MEIPNINSERSEIISMTNFENHESSQSEPKKSIEDNINKFLVEKVEVVYQNMKHETKYHKCLKVILTLFSIISYSFLFNMYFMFAVNRQHIYCFNPSYNQFEICSSNQICANHNTGISIIIYDNSQMSNITNIDNEILNVNKKYRDFFYENAINIFSKITYDKISDFTQFFRKFNGGVMLTENEHVNISLKYNDLCNQSTTIIIFGIFMYIGIIVSNLLLSICADIIGRRKILIFSLIICSTFCILFFAIVMKMDILIQESKDKLLSEEKVDYPENYREIITLYSINQETNIIFKQYKIILIFFLFIIHFSNTSAQQTSLCLIVENSINDSLVFKNFWIYNNGIILSIFYSYISVYPFNDFKYYYLFNGVFLLIILFFVIYFVKESPRQFYEFSEWIPYTKLFNSIIREKKDNIKSLYVSQQEYEDIKKIEQSALAKRQISVRNSILSSFKRSSVFEIIQQHLILIRESVKKDKDLVFKRNELRMNPFIIITCLYYEKNVRDNNPIIWAFLILVFFIFNLIMTVFYSRYFFTRDGLFAIYIVNSSFFHISLVFLVSNAFFFIALQFFGFKRVMTLCFIGILVLAMIIDFPLTILPKCLGDLNQYNYTLMSYYINDAMGKTIRVSVFFIGFFTWGLYYATYIYIFKYTKTIYRCTFFGVIDVISKSCFFGTGLIQIYFNSRILLIAGIASFIAAFTILFLTDKDEDVNIICDKKKFEFSKNYKS